MRSRPPTSGFPSIIHRQAAGADALRGKRPGGVSDRPDADGWGRGPGPAPSLVVLSAAQVEMAAGKQDLTRERVEKGMLLEVDSESLPGRKVRTGQVEDGVPDAVGKVVFLSEPRFEMP